ncbi:hypothetical protein PT974_05901 [Cladobotryum mycophilum]|uniref:F-box domain-containing protein n=1 Tax=Cladobotryum mycophilum TaxID=491253 RepID=A0ABR0SKC0_9HYPO
MDRFQNLSPELSLKILLSCRDFSEAIAFSHASPALYSQLQGSRSKIIWHCFYNDLGEDVIQDALAIVLFPVVNHDEVTKEERTAMLQSHLTRWGRKGFRLVAESYRRGFSIVLQVENLIRHLWLYAKDYLAKATSQHLPRAYRKLPSWSHRDFCQTTTQVSLEREVDHFDIESLSKKKQRLILQAFLRYHLLCKIYGPVGGKLRVVPTEEFCNYDSVVETEYNGYRFDPRDPFRYWDWSLLYRYEDREPETREIQLLPCVREYVLGLYGATIADQVGAGIPTAGTHPEFENAPKNGEGRFQDYDPYSGWERLHHLGGTGWSDGVISLLASSGLDLLTSILRSPVTDFRDFIVIYNQEILRSPPLVDATNVWLPLSAPSRRRRMRWHCNDFVRLHRQRAWALWDDDARHPKLPSEDEYRDIYGPGPVGGLVGWGLENDDTRNEFISHGQGVIAYPSLLAKKPFWKFPVNR